MHLVVWFGGGDPEGRVSAFISDVDKVEHFLNGRLRISGYDPKFVDLEHVRAFELVNEKGTVCYTSVQLEKKYPPG